MTTYNSEYQTLFSQSMENNFSFHNLESENENELSLSGEFSNSFTSILDQQDPCQNQYREESMFSSFHEFNPMFIPEEEKENEDEKNRAYYIQQKDNFLSSNQTQTQKFEITKETSPKNNLYLAKKKKRGRGTKNPDPNLKTHDKFAPDNLLRKIQVHYLTFIIAFLNEILQKMNYGKRFLKLDYEFKKNVNKTNIQNLKTKNIKDIICNKISKKYRNKEANNLLICEEIKDKKENELINNILSENYLKLFKKIYYKSNKIINLKEYGLDENIVLSRNIKMFDDLLKVKENEAYDNHDQYIKYIKECAIQNYLPESIFLYH